MGRDADEESEPEAGFQFIGDGEAGDGDPPNETDAEGFEFVEDPERDTDPLEPAVDRDSAEPNSTTPVVEDATEPRVGAARESGAPTSSAGRQATAQTAETGSEHTTNAVSTHPARESSGQQESVLTADELENSESTQNDQPTSSEHHGETHGEQHAHHPVVEDWPRGVGDASWWPIVTAVGAAGVYVSVALWLLGRGADSIIGGTVGPTAFLGAFAITLFGIYGWLYHGFVAHFWARGTSRLTGRSLRWGMLLFIATEIATFGALFAYYFYIRAGPWPPANAMAGGVDLLNVLVVANTAVLLLSSLTVHFAHHALAHGNRKRFTRLMTITVGLGLVFLAGQAVEYHRFINREGFDWTSGVLGSAFFGLTGLHGGHVAFGALLLTITLVRGKHGQFDGDRDVSLALVSLYWHFVDAVWLFLVAALYIGASFGG